MKRFRKTMQQISWMCMISALVMMFYIACVFFTTPREATWMFQLDLFIFVIGAALNIIFERR
jgi:hypothetical protein